eukprot:COSAG02_NODE_245_length_27293_cov_16.488012_13_plen_2534_part_00
MQVMPGRGTEDEGIAARVARKSVGARVKSDVDYPLLRASWSGDVGGMVARLETVSADGCADVEAALVRPIHAAATRTDARALQLLLKHGASVDSCDPSGFTALHVACHHGATSCIIELVRAGCGGDRRDNNGRTARQIAEDRGHAEALSVLDGIISTIPHLQAAKEALKAEAHGDVVEACQKAMLKEPARAREWILLELTVTSIVDGMRATCKTNDREYFRFYWELVEKEPEWHQLTDTLDGVCISYEQVASAFVRDLAFDLVRHGLPLPYCELGSETSGKCKILVPVVSTGDAATAYGRQGSSTSKQFSFAVAGKGRGTRSPPCVVPLFLAGDSYPPRGGVSIVLSTTQFIDARESCGWEGWIPRSRDDWLAELVERLNFFLMEKQVSGVAEVFLSYRITETATFVQWLRRKFADEGVVAYVGESELQGGGDWTAELNAAIDGCKLFVALISPTYATTDEKLGSLWTKREFDHANNKGKPITALWCGGEYPPKALGFQLSSVDPVDTRELAKHEEAFARCMNDLRAINRGSWVSQERQLKQHHVALASATQDKTSSTPPIERKDFGEECQECAAVQQQLADCQAIIAKLRAPSPVIHTIKVPEDQDHGNAMSHGLQTSLSSASSVSSNQLTGLGEEESSWTGVALSSHRESQWFQYKLTKPDAADHTIASAIVDRKIGWVSRLWDSMGTQHVEAGGSLADPKTIREPGRWTIIRLFLSSTFTDTHSERDIVIKKVIPELNEWLARESYWIKFEVEDLRWGIGGQDVKIQATCVNLINHCRPNGEGKPWMICFRTSRIGSIQDELDSADRFDEPGSVKWINHLQDQGLQLPITSIEVLHGCLQYPPDFPGPAHCLSLFRDSAFEKHVDPEWRWIFEREHVSPISEAAFSSQRHLYTVAKNDDAVLAIIRDKGEIDNGLRASSHVICADYAGDGATGYDKQIAGARVGYGRTMKQDACKKRFESLVLNKLKEMIQREYKPLSQPDGRKAEQLPHLLAVEDRSRMLFGRNSLLDKMQSFCSLQNPRGLLAVHGKPGCGKSALMATFIRQLVDKHQQVIYHVVGSSPTSVNLRFMLLRLCSELAFLLPAGEHFSEALTTAELSSLWAILARQVFEHSGKPVIIVIDAVNQLRRVGDAWSMRWLPKRLPRGVKVVVSMLEYERNCLQSLRRRLSRLNRQELEVTPLDYEHCRQLVKKCLGVYHKELCEDPEDALLGDQMGILLDMEQASSPLFLVAACEQLRRYGIYENLTTFMTHTLPGTARTLFRHLLSTLEQDHGAELVEFCLSAIVLSRSGLSSAAMHDLCEAHAWKQDQISSFSRIREALGVFLTAGGGFGLLQFFHDQLAAECKARYRLRNSARAKLLYVEMADYFSTIRSRRGCWDEFFYSVHSRDFARADKTLDKLSKAVDQVPGDAAAGRVADLIAECLDDVDVGSAGLLGALESTCGHNNAEVFFLPLLLCHDGVDETLHRFLSKQLPAEVYSHLEMYVSRDDNHILRFAHTSLRDQATNRYGLHVGCARTVEMVAQMDDFDSSHVVDTVWFRKEQAYQQLLRDKDRRSQAECIVDSVGLDIVGRTGVVFFVRAFRRLGYSSDASKLDAGLTALVSRLPMKDGALHEETFAQLAKFCDFFGARALFTLMDSTDASTKEINPRAMNKFSKDYQVCMDAVTASVIFHEAPGKLGVIPVVALLQDKIVDVNLAGFMLTTVEAHALVHCIEFSCSLASVTFSGRGDINSTTMQVKHLVETERAELHAREASISAAVFATSLCCHRYFCETLRVIDLKRTEFMKESDDGEFSDIVGLNFARALPSAAHVEFVDLRESRMSQRVAVAICMAAKQCKLLESLDLRGNLLEFGSLAHLLENHDAPNFTFNGFQYIRPTTQTLQLRRLDDDHTMIATACVVARTWSHLTSINLDFNPLGNRGAVVIAAGLPCCELLSELSLQDCDIGPTGAKALLNGFAPAVQPKGPVHLADEAELAVDTTFGALGRNLDLGYENQKVKIKRLDVAQYNRSISLHAPGSVTFDTSRFRDSLLRMSVAVNGDVRDVLRGFMFEVIGDGNVLWTSKKIDDVYSLEQCEVDISSVTHLTLVTGCCDVNWGGHTVFVNPSIVPLCDFQEPNTTPEPEVAQSMTDWTAQQILEWVDSILLPPNSVASVRAAFQDNCTDGEDLMELTPERLQKLLSKTGTATEAGVALAKLVIDARDAHPIDPEPVSSETITPSSASKLTRLDLRNNCICGLQRWKPDNLQFEFEPDPSIPALVERVNHFHPGLSLLITDNACFSAGANHALFLSACNTMNCDVGLSMLERLLASECAHDLDKQLDGERVIALLRVCLDSSSFAASRRIISGLEGDTETLSVCKDEWDHVSGVTHGVKVFDRRMDGVERVLDVHPILNMGVLGDTPLHIAVRSKSFHAAKRLLARGADPSLSNAYDVSVLDMVAQMRDDEVPIPTDFLDELGEDHCSEEGYDDSDNESDESSADSGEGAINCPGGHGLRLVTVKKHSSISCDVCRSKIGAGEQSRECRRCDFDLCVACCQDM